MSPRGIKGSGSGAVKTNTKRDVGDPTYDLIRVFEQRDIDQMDDTELEQRITNLQKMRLIRVTTSKKKTALDDILSQLDVDKAEMILKSSEMLEREKETKL